MGYTSLWTPEDTGHDSFQLCSHRWAAAFRRLATGLDVAIVRVVAARPGIAATLAVLHACRPELVEHS